MRASSESDITNERTGIIMGSGGPSTRTIVEAAEITLKNNSPKRIGPFAVPKAMSSTASATLATWFKIHGVNYSISSACSTSAHCIGNADELIQWGKQDVMFAGGHEDLDWTMSNLFDAMGAMSSKYNDTPSAASRAYDVNRDGFVIAGGAGVLVLEELEHAKARGAKIYAEIVGYGATSDGYDMVAPSGEGAIRCMRQALATVSGAGRLHQHPRHLDAGRRFQGNGRDPRGVRREDAAHHLDQVADRPFAGRGRRAGIDLLDPDDAGRLHRRKRPYRRRSIRNSRACRSCASASTTPRSTPSCPIPSASAAPTPRSFSSAIPHKPRFQRIASMDGLMKGKRGLVMGVANDHSIAWGIAQKLSEQGAELAFTYQGEAFGRRVKPLADKLGASLRRALRRRGQRLGRSPCSRRLARPMGRTGLRRPRHRLFRQERAEGPLRRHQPRQLRPHHGDLLLLLHRSGPQCGGADDAMAAR